MACCLLRWNGAYQVRVDRVRMWVSDGGLLMCGDQALSTYTGIPANEMIGTAFSSLFTDVQAAGNVLCSVLVASICMLVWWPGVPYL